MNMRSQVAEFHLKFGHPVATTPHVPDAAAVRFRLALIAEEFVELLEAAHGGRLSIVRYALENTCRTLPLNVDLPAFVDALGDLDYVIEGTRLVFGVDGDPIAAEIHRANMNKVANGTHKPTKPIDWSPPDIEGELIKQGL